MGYSIVSQNHGNPTNQASDSSHRPIPDSDQCPTSPQISIHPTSYQTYQTASYTGADSPRPCSSAESTSAPVPGDDAATATARIVDIVAGRCDATMPTRPSVDDDLHIHVNPDLPPTQSPETRVYSSEAQNAVVGQATPCPPYTQLPIPDLPVVVELENASQTPPPEYQVVMAGSMSPPGTSLLFSSELVPSGGTPSMSAALMDDLMSTSWVNSLATTDMASGMSSVSDRLSPLSISLVGLPDVEDVANDEENKLAETSNEECAVPEYEEQGNYEYPDIRSLDG